MLALVSGRNLQVAGLLLLICTASISGECTWGEWIAWGIGGAVVAVVAAPVAVSALGFSAAGITAGSIAAGMMSTAATAAGGGVATGSVVAVLQSAGAAGIGVAAKAKIATVAGAAAVTAYQAINCGSSGNTEKCRND